VSARGESLGAHHSEAPVASVVVPAYNAAATIGDCISSLLALHAPREGFEVLIVDNGSTDGTRDVVRTFGAGVRMISEATRGAAAARNRGIREARGSRIAFTDADCVVDPDWLGALLDPLDDPAIGVVGGSISSRRPCNRVELFGEMIHDMRVAIEESNPPYVATGNWGSRRDVLLDVGLFDETLLRGQDVDLAWRIHLAGYRLVHEPRALVSHQNERTVWGLMREGFVHGVHGVRVRAKHSALGTRGVRPRTRIGARLLRDVGRLVHAGDRLQAMLQLLFDLGKAGGEVAALARGRGSAARPAGDAAGRRREVHHP
jgi:glycosyltransferase involved in cell wall biosynthesis